MTLTKEQWVRLHFPEVDHIDALFDQTTVNRVRMSLESGGYLKTNHLDQNYESAKNLILRIQKKFKNSTLGIGRKNNKEIMR